MKKSLLLLISICSLCLLNGCGGGSSSPPPLTPDVATHFSVVPATTTPTAGTAFNFTVSALDGSNGVVSSYAGTVHFTSSDGQAVLPANSTLTNGTGTFSVTMKTVGGQTITATDTATVSITGTSNSISVNGPPATHFSVLAPANDAAGTSFSFTVSALDASNNLVPNYAGTVHFTSTDAQAMLPANSTLTNGTGTFSATLKSVGGQTITAADAATASITGTSNSINVTGPATHFSLTVPAAVTIWIGTDFNFTFAVTALDASNNVAVSYSGTVHFTSTDAQALLPANSILMNGTANFPGGLKTIGSQTITATDTVTASITGTSSSIKVSDPPPPVVNTTPAVSAGAVNLPYSFAFTATGGQPPLTWSETGALPPGLGPLSNGGVLSGTPTQVGSFPITVMAQDSLGQNSAPQDFTISVFLHGFKATGSMNGGRYAHTATLLNNGKVLVTGGQHDVPQTNLPVVLPPITLATAELYEPTSGTFTGTGSMETARLYHTSTLLKDGTVLVTGGLDSNSLPLASAELFDPTTGTFTPTTGRMSVARYGHTATLLSNGKVLVTGGAGGTTAELYDPTSETFTPTTGSMQAARSHHTATLLKDGAVLLTGGGLATAELYDPASETFTPTRGSMETARLYNTSTLLKDGTVLVTGGEDSNNQALASAELYDPTTDTFTPTTGTMETPRGGHTATLLSDGTVLVTGGSGGTTAELYDPTSGTFTGTGSMEFVCPGHTATLLKDGTVLVTGGSNLRGHAIAAAELYQ
jgi:hypothetical protein